MSFIDTFSTPRSAKRALARVEDACRVAGRVCARGGIRLEHGQLDRLTLGRHREAGLPVRRDIRHPYEVLGAIGARVLDRDLPVAAAQTAFQEDGRLHDDQHPGGDRRRADDGGGAGPGRRLMVG
jgi:hypothetical protein